ncbi:MAG: DUF2130 domain-containing protein [Malacoplasma sp.]|nr:DUF2130 domain-containing protein [Malacoplasma sp.]
MGKKIRIKIKDGNNLEFELCEDANKGDWFNLNDVNDIDFSGLQEQIRNKQNQFVNEQIKKEEDNWLYKYKASQEHQNLINELNNLRNDKKNFESFREKDKQIAFKEAENRYNSEITTLNNKIKSLEEKKQLELDNKIQEYEGRLALEKERYQNQLLNQKQDFQNQIELIKSAKSRNMKDVGEDLEKYIFDRFSNTLGFIDDCSLEKANKPIGGTKPDFIFKVIDKDTRMELIKVVIEAKSKYAESEGRKNREFFEKLKKDQENNNGDYSLLITELEDKEDFLIRKVSDEQYSNMFMVRPEYFTIFLSIIRFISLKRKEIINAEIKFESKQKILSEFESLKDEILKNSVKNIDDNIADILKEADKISNCAINIKSKAAVITSRHLNTIKNKIEGFKIRKILNDIKKTEDSEFN